MEEIKFRASSERLADETRVVSVAGELDLYTAPHEKEARTQTLFRDVNERIEQIAADMGADAKQQLICECGNPDCTRQIELTAAEYEQVRAHASRFIIALNHENPETESIVEQNNRFAVVETYAGASSRIARETDPRSQQHIRTSQPPASAENETQTSTARGRMP